jgi:uncharacterized repeat protein (TIGR02543 family)
VSYDGNGKSAGSVPTDTNNYLQGQTVAVLGNNGKLERIGYSFSGWNTQADGSGASYAPGSTFPMGNANVTLYAVWTALPTYTVSYDGNGNTGGSAPVDSTNYLQGATVTVLGNSGVLVKAGSSFVGWNTLANGSGTSYSQGQTFTIGSANVTLHAVWTALSTYTVSYDGNSGTGGSAPADSTNYLQGATVTVLGNTGNLVRTSYSFSGWNTQPDGSGTTFTQDSTFVMGSANVTLYAKWTATTLPTYTVSYSGNGADGGSVPVDTTNYLQGQAVTVPGNTGNLVRIGYSFSGWNTLASGSGTTYTQGQSFTMGSAAMTLYAKWTPTYTVTYNGNGNTGGSVPVDTINYLQGQTVSVPSNSGNLLRASYAFSGWNTQADGSGTSYAASSTFTMGSANITLFAQWILAYTVGYNGNGATGGDVPTDTNSYPQGQTVTVLGNTGNLVRTGYSFSGVGARALVTELGTDCRIDKAESW